MRHEVDDPLSRSSSAREGLALCSKAAAQTTQAFSLSEESLHLGGMNFMALEFRVMSAASL
jgi:hypothetical protein